MEMVSLKKNRFLVYSTRWTERFLLEVTDASNQYHTSETWLKNKAAEEAEAEKGGGAYL